MASNTATGTAVDAVASSVLVTPTGESSETVVPAPTTSHAAQSAHASKSSSSTTSRQPPTPNILEIDLHTIVIIPDFSLYYTGNISNFRPSYRALSDGSLVANPLISDIRSANVQLAATSALAAFFFLTSWLATQYIRRGKVKRKFLFYELLASQLLGLAAMILMIIPFFAHSISCVASEAAVVILAAFSYALLMTGVLGFKAYRVLDSSKLILVVLGALRAVITALVVLYLSKSHFTRRLSGGCLPAFSQGLMGVIILLHAAEAAFISGCFLVAVYKSSRSSAVRGRLSISVSVRDTRDHRGIDEYKTSREESDCPRGWWDYVPPQPQEARTDARSMKTMSDAHGMGRLKSHSFTSTNVPPQFSYATAGGVSIAQPPLPPLPDAVRSHLRTESPPPPSVGSRLSRYMPRMQVFKEVVKNELTYCTLVTVMLLVISLLSKFSAQHAIFKDSAEWVSVAWVLLSLFTLGSFGEVVRRHERDAILQHPSAWDPVYRAELEASRAFSSGRNGRSYSPVSVCSRTHTRAPIFTNPFSDAHSVPNVETVTRTGSARSRGTRVLRRYNSTSSSLQELTRPWESTRSLSHGSLMSGASSLSAISPAGDMAFPLFRQSTLESIRSSPTTGQYPTLRSVSPVPSEFSDTATHGRARLSGSGCPPPLEPFARSYREDSITSLLPRSPHENNGQNPFGDGILSSS